MNFVIVGCGRVGAELCYGLFATGHQIVVIDSRKEALNRLHPDFRGRTLEGEGLSENCGVYCIRPPRVDSEVLRSTTSH